MATATTPTPTPVGPQQLTQHVQKLGADSVAEWYTDASGNTVPQQSRVWTLSDLQRQIGQVQTNASAQEARLQGMIALLTTTPAA